MLRKLNIKNQSVETSGIPKEYKDAILEYIWNGFEADATEVNVNFTFNEVEGVYDIKIIDNGKGIIHDEIENTFGTFLVSEKNKSPLHIKSKNNKGKGRFSFFSFATDAEWITTYSDGDKLFNYKIGISNISKENYEDSAVEEVFNTKTGTMVTLYGIDNLTSKDVSFATMKEYLLTNFAWFLYLNKDKNLKLTYDNSIVNYQEYIDDDFSGNTSILVDGYQFDVNIIVWTKKIKERFGIYYLGNDNTFKGTQTSTLNRNTLDFSHSVIVTSSFLNQLDSIDFDFYSEQTTMSESESLDVKSVLRKLKSEIVLLLNKKFNEYRNSKADIEIQKMISERKTFPVFQDDPYDNLRKEHLITVTKELYCIEPLLFYKLKPIQEKSLLMFLKLLLDSEERENLLSIITEIVDLSPSQRSDFAEILKKSKLENVIDTIKFVENRYQIIEILKTLIYNLPKFTNERDHIQKIIESNYWIFGERYNNLVSADIGMQKALENYQDLILQDGSKSKLLENDENNRRMDIFLCSSQKTENSFENAIEENLIVELKAPNVKLTKKVLRQIEDYMDYIISQPEFNSTLRKWKFFAVCREVDEDIKSRYRSVADKGKPCLVHAVNNYEIYAFTWDDIFRKFNLSHNFILDKLKLERDTLLINHENNDGLSGRDLVNKLVEKTK